jgi:long-chain acyl-CoA synthetase
MAVRLSASLCISDPEGVCTDAPALDVADILSATKFPIPSPTILFLKPEHVQSLASSVMDRAKKSFFMFPLAWRHKFASLTEGFVNKDSLWDRTVFGKAREDVLGKMADTVKAVVISGGMLCSIRDNSRCLSNYRTFTI